MLFTPGRCALCGSQPTVKSHIIPRGLAHDLRADSKHLIGGNLHKLGVSFPQSGRWDSKILCEKHEAALTVYDDYGIRFVRAFRNTLLGGEAPTIAVPNPTPSHLQRFFLALIWRKDLSNQVFGKASELDSYSGLIREALFNNKELNTPIIILRSPTALNGKRIAVFVEPHRAKFGELNAWKCDLGWIGAMVVLDQKPLLTEWRHLDATRHTIAEVVNMDPIDIRSMDILRPILSNMRGRPKA